MNAPLLLALAAGLAGPEQPYRATPRQTSRHEAGAGWERRSGKKIAAEKKAARKAAAKSRRKNRRKS